VAKPIVDGLEADLHGRAEVLRIDFLSGVGRAAARAYGVNIVPMMLLFDREGRVVLRDAGLPDAGAIKEQVAALTEEIK
jgi:hypothetical protein